MAEAFWLDLDDVQMAEDYFSGQVERHSRHFFFLCVRGALFIAFPRRGEGGRCADNAELRLVKSVCLLAALPLLVL